MVSLKDCPDDLPGMKKTAEKLLVSLFKGVSKAREGKIRARLSKELREELVAELTPVLRDQVEDEIMGEMYDKARDEVKAEIEGERPTPKQRDAFQTFVRETEIDTHAQAAVASGDADRLTTRLKWSRMTWGYIPYIIMVMMTPALYGVLQYTGKLVSIETIGAAITMFLTFLSTVLINTRRHDRLEKEAKRLYKIASDFLILAERAKSFRIVHAEKLESKARIAELTGQLREHKVRLDERFHPSVKTIDSARQSVRSRILMDESVTLRFDDDTDEKFERLEEAEAEAEAARVVEG